MCLLILPVVPDVCFANQLHCVYHLTCKLHAHPVHVVIAHKFVIQLREEGVVA